MAAWAVQPLGNFLPAGFGDAQHLQQIFQFGVEIEPGRLPFVAWLAIFAIGELRLHPARKSSQLLFIKTIVGW